MKQREFIRKRKAKLEGKQEGIASCVSKRGESRRIRSAPWASRSDLPADHSEDSSRYQK
jgi:hypothetical protein